MKKNASLYIHIPFCASLCDYCDFYSVGTDSISEKNIDSFLDALAGDIHSQIRYFDIEEITTAYIGGGTPSVLGTKIKKLFDALKNEKTYKPAEFTVEANPESLDEDFLSLCRDYGVNRLSLGVQTFHEPSRKAVNRMGDIKTLEKSLSLASRYFDGCLSADLITGLPLQSEITVLEDIKRLLSYNPSHVSLYSLTSEKHEVYTQDSEEADNLWLSGRHALKDAGFEHYEVSNFALKGKRCLHNIAYWLMEDWLGAGPAASGTIIDEEAACAKRYTYRSDFESYIRKPSIHEAECEEIDKKLLMYEFFFMGYRYAEGPDERRFKDIFGLTINECIGKTLSRWKDKDKMMYLNKFLYEALIEMESNIPA